MYLTYSISRTQSCNDYFYPFDLCGGVYRVDFVERIMNICDDIDVRISSSSSPTSKAHSNARDMEYRISNPNSFEQVGNAIFWKHFYQQPYTTLSCPAYPCLAVITINRVQDLYNVPIYSAEVKHSLDNLNKLLVIDKAPGAETRTCHENKSTLYLQERVEEERQQSLSHSSQCSASSQERSHRPHSRDNSSDTEAPGRPVTAEGDGEAGVGEREELCYDLKKYRCSIYSSTHIGAVYLKSKKYKENSDYGRDNDECCSCGGSSTANESVICRCACLGSSVNGVEEVLPLSTSVTSELEDPLNPNSALKVIRTSMADSHDVSVRWI